MSLYVGGRKGIEEACRKTLHRVRQDELLGRFFQDFDVEELCKRKAAFYTAALTKGRPTRLQHIRALHEPFDIQEPHFKAFLDALQKMFLSMGWSEQHVAAAIAELEKYKHVIVVDPDRAASGLNSGPSPLQRVDRKTSQLSWPASDLSANDGGDVLLGQGDGEASVSVADAASPVASGPPALLIASPKHAMVKQRLADVVKRHTDQLGEARRRQQMLLEAVTAAVKSNEADKVKRAEIMSSIADAEAEVAELELANAKMSQQIAEAEATTEQLRLSARMAHREAAALRLERAQAEASSSAAEAIAGRRTLHRAAQSAAQGARVILSQRRSLLEALTKERAALETTGRLLAEQIETLEKEKETAWKTHLQEREDEVVEMTARVERQRENLAKRTALLHSLISKPETPPFLPLPNPTTSVCGRLRRSSPRSQRVAGRRTVGSPRIGRGELQREDWLLQRELRQVGGAERRRAKAVAAEPDPE